MAIAAVSTEPLLIATAITVDKNVRRYRFDWQKLLQTYLKGSSCNPGSLLRFDHQKPVKSPCCSCDHSYKCHETPLFSLHKTHVLRIDVEKISPFASRLPEIRLLFVLKVIRLIDDVCLRLGYSILFKY